jgi:hypothetical protein
MLVTSAGDDAAGALGSVVIGAGVPVLSGGAGVAARAPDGSCVASAGSFQGDCTGVLFCPITGSPSVTVLADLISGEVLGVFGLGSGELVGLLDLGGPPTCGIDGMTNFWLCFGGPPLSGTGARSPIITHSARAFIASIRPPRAGGTGRGSAGMLAGRGATLGGAGFIASRAFSSSPSTILLVGSGSTNRIVMPMRPCNADGFGDEAMTSATPSIITPPSFSVSATRLRRPAGSGRATGTNSPVRSA